MSLSLADYWMGRDDRYPDDLAPRVRSNAAYLVECVNRLIGLYEAGQGPRVWTVNSGWRPPAVNANVPNAARRSRHMSGEAVDLGDDDGLVDAWCIRATGLAGLAECGLYLEHPQATPRWTHWQTAAPGSGNRVFHP